MYIPVALPAALLLDPFGISINVTVLGKVARKSFFGCRGSVSKGSVVATVDLVGASHYQRCRQHMWQAEMEAVHGPMPSIVPSGMEWEGEGQNSLLSSELVETVPSGVLMWCSRREEQ